VQGDRTLSLAREARAARLSRSYRAVAAKTYKTRQSARKANGCRGKRRGRNSGEDEEPEHAALPVVSCRPSGYVPTYGPCLTFSPPTVFNLIVGTAKEGAWEGAKEGLRMAAIYVRGIGHVWGNDVTG